MKKDYYEILGLGRDASLQEIKKKYRSLALKHHPDRVPAEKKKEAEERFKEISEAYGVLSDPQKRKMYDQYGHAGIDQNYTAEDIFRGADFSGFGDLGDIFSQFFGDSVFDVFGGGRAGRGRQSHRAARGRDIQYEMEITLKEAFQGGRKKISVPRYEYCQDCKGTGARNGTALKTCSACQGQGQVFMSSGFFRMAQTCSTCGGRGQMVTEVCSKCSGRGVNRVTRTIEVNIPAGVDSDTRLRIRGEGEVAQGGAGDLYIYMRVLPDKHFLRKGKDLHMEMPVSFVKGALGGEVTVPTLNGSVTMKIPAGTQSGKVFRLKAKGMQDLHGGAPGHQYVTVMLQVPSKMTAEQKRLLDEFARVSGEEVDKPADSFAEKLKNVFK